MVVLKGTLVLMLQRQTSEALATRMNSSALGS
jgi:hypothetical protein